MYDAFFVSSNTDAGIFKCIFTNSVKLFFAANTD